MYSPQQCHKRELIWPLLLLGEVQDSVEVKELSTAKECPFLSYIPLAVPGHH